MLSQIVRGALLIPADSGRVDFFADGALACDERGVIVHAGDWRGLEAHLPADSPPVRRTDAVLLPPLIDIHIHIPQHPIRGRFIEGVPPDAPGGMLLNGLRRNVFPAESRCNIFQTAYEVTQQFLADTLANGVVAGAAYMTPSTLATEIALENLPETWRVGLVMMNQRCPEDLRTDEKNFEADVKRLAARFGDRLIVTDRFAVSVDTPLRVRGSRLARELGLCTQTHLNEQCAEKKLVETELYPDAKSYAEVYRRDGLLDRPSILAHCIHMTENEWRIVAGCGAVVAHCPTSNALLNSGRMPLDDLMRWKIPYAIATDVGASPTVSMLAEMNRFLQVHAGKSAYATPSEALFRATLAPAKILGLEKSLGSLQPGRPMSFIEAAADGSDGITSADQCISLILPENLDKPAPSVERVVLAGKTIFERRACHA